MTVNIHGKEYVTVAERLTEAHKGDTLQGVTTEVLQHEPSVVVKATVNIKGHIYTGISSANPAKSIEKASPYEVAETSAVGRALGFAGYGAVESIATAEEMKKATDDDEEKAIQSWDKSFPDKETKKTATVTKGGKEMCPLHPDKELFLRRWKNPDGSTKSHNDQVDGKWQYCSGHGYEDSNGANPKA